MDLQDVTKNQHFVPQVEQRLNAINPSAKDENKKIYSFSVIDRENHKFKLDSNKGSRIEKNLSLHDLFSFDVLEKEGYRYNFERLFHRYEAHIKVSTKSLLSKISTPGADVKSEVLSLYTAKFMNFIRNPYSIKKIINTFSMLGGLKPTDTAQSQNFDRVIEGRKPHQRYLCERLEISESEYSDWLSIIFLLLTPIGNDESNLFEELIKSLYEDPELFVMVLVYTYDDKACLLSDRGYSIPLPEKDHMAWDFNLYSHGFIRYVFANIDLIAPKNAPIGIIEKFKEAPKSVDVHKISNDLSALAQYNQHVAYQCHKKVFNSSDECYGLILSA